MNFISTKHQQHKHPNRAGPLGAAAADRGGAERPLHPRPVLEQRQLLRGRGPHHDLRCACFCWCCWTDFQCCDFGRCFSIRIRARHPTINHSITRLWLRHDRLQIRHERGIGPAVRTHALLRRRGRAARAARALLLQVHCASFFLSPQPTLSQKTCDDPVSTN